ncbi:MAG: SCO6745 family protein [Acidimicrobiales bacterium]
MTTDELLSRVCPLINDLGYRYYFVPETVARGEELGLDVFQFYFLGRGGTLGDVDAAVVHSAFGYFNPAVVEAMWTSGCEKVSPREAAAAHFACAAELGRARLTGRSGLAEFCAAAEQVVAAAEPAGLTLFAAFRHAPLVEDPEGRALQLVAVLRELRGSAHLAAVRAAGLSDKVAHFLTRPEAMTLFGWPEGDVPEVDDAQRAARVEVEAMTDRILAPAFAVLDDSGSAALLAGIEAIAEALEG